MHNDNYDNKFELSEGDYEPVKKSFIGSVIGAVRNSFKGRSSSQNIGRSRSLIADGETITGQYLPAPKAGPSQSIFRDGREANDYSGNRINSHEYIDQSNYLRQEVDNLGLTGRQHASTSQLAYQPRKVIIPAQFYQAYKQYKQQQSGSQSALLAILDQQHEQIQALEQQNELILQKAEEMRTEYIKLAKEATVTAVKFPSRLSAKTQNSTANTGASSEGLAASTSTGPAFSFGASATVNKSSGGSNTTVQNENKPADATSSATASAAKPFTFNFGTSPTGGQTETGQPEKSASVAEAPVAKSTASQEAPAAKAPTFTFGVPKAESGNAAQGTSQTEKPTFSFNFGPSATEKPAVPSMASIAPTAAPAATPATVADPNANQNAQTTTKGFTFNFGTTSVSEQSAAASAAPAAAEQPKFTFGNTSTVTSTAQAGQAQTFKFNFGAAKDVGK